MVVFFLDEIVKASNFQFLEYMYTQYMQIFLHVSLSGCITGRLLQTLYSPKHQ